ncbi:hypothetical protein A2U01_0038781 [Trifolium medium]|uniref:Uncharacterized protein n=1 Tax=Trifolium medium TaxID=97028 RepID=A0A392Q167_9FABA|nr:hypothetical protein [Trifolium medium]
MATKSTSVDVGDINHSATESSGGEISFVPESIDGLNLEVVLPANGQTQTSGMAFILEDGNNNMSIVNRNNSEAEKLLHIQKQVGFSYEDQDGDVIVVLEKDETRDRKKKAEWEQNNCSQ